MSTKAIKRELRRLADSERAEVLKRFFKTGPGEYAEGDIFLGIRVPYIRKLAKKYEDISLSETTRLLKSAIHEERLLALLLLVSAYSRGGMSIKKRVYELYLKNTRFINNWDLVDLSAEHIAGAFLMDRSRRPLYKLARSGILWERRISILSTFHYIKRDDLQETMKIAEILLSDKEDLIHKAVGWMLREAGKRDLRAEEEFLKEHYRQMPRTMLRYAIERFPETRRLRYLRGKA
jgi:3-methyladenine DNA glycosylase AlkD